MPPREDDRLSGRVRRVAQVGVGLSSAALAVGANQLFGRGASAGSARALAAALGGVKGPLMKVAQMLATIPDLLPPEYALELQGLQTNAPPMGWSFVKRRMRAELGEGWENRFARFEREAAHAASLGQVHRATAHDGRALAVKLQYPDMPSAVEADLIQLRAALAVFRAAERSIDPTEAVAEVGDRLREELDYAREAKAMRLYRRMLASEPGIRVPEPIDELSTGRLLAMTWLEGARITDFKAAALPVRNAIAERLFAAWWRPMSAYGVIHGDPHLGNYAVAAPEQGSVDGSVLNLLDFGCIRIFPARFVAGVVGLYRALETEDRAAQRAAYESWGFAGVSEALLDALNLWAQFIYGPILEDRERTVADGISPGLYGRREAFAVRERLKLLGPVRIPREFVFMDRAAIGLGAAFLHLDAKLNFHALFEAAIEGFDAEKVAARQQEALGEVGLTF